MASEPEKFFTGPFKPSNCLLVMGMAWFFFITAYPLKYANPIFVFPVLIAVASLTYGLIWKTSGNHILGLSLAFTFSAMTPFLNDKVLVTPVGGPCIVTGKYHWVSPNKRSGNTSGRWTYQLDCPDGLKEAGGPMFRDYPYEIGDTVRLKQGFFNFEHI